MFETLSVQIWFLALRPKERKGKRKIIPLTTTLLKNNHLITYFNNRMLYLYDNNEYR